MHIKNNFFLFFLGIMDQPPLDWVTRWGLPNLVGVVTFYDLFFIVFQFFSSFPSANQT